jgi:hypothetical protein
MILTPLFVDCDFFGPKLRHSLNEMFRGGFFRKLTTHHVAAFRLSFDLIGTTWHEVAAVRAVNRASMCTGSGTVEPLGDMPSLDKFSQEEHVHECLSWMQQNGFLESCDLRFPGTAQHVVKLQCISR